jgi:hypothetical protein
VAVLTYFSSRHLLQRETISSQNSMGKSDGICFALNVGSFSRMIDAKETPGVDGNVSVVNSSKVLRWSLCGR